MSINIINANAATHVNICGCGACSDGAGSGGAAGGNGAEGPPGTIPGNFDYEGYTRLIDVCADAQNIFIEPFLQWVDLVQTGAISIDLLIPVEFLPLIDDVSDSFQAIELEIQTGSEVLTAVKRRLIKHLPDPVPPFTRQAIRNLFIGELPGGFQNVRTLLRPPLPIVLNGAPIYSAFVLWSLTANLNAVNSAMLAAKGIATRTPAAATECRSLFDEIGRPEAEALPAPTPSADESELILEDTSAGLKYTRLFTDAQIFQGSSDVINVQGEGFVGVLSTMNIVNPVTSGAIFNNRVLGLFEFDFSGVLRSSNYDTGGPGAGSGAEEVKSNFTGLGTLPGLAFTFDPVLFAPFENKDGINDPDVNYPQAGPFSAEMTFSTRGGVSVNGWELWIVTELTGSVQVVPA